MTNPMKGESEIELADGRKFTLAFNANAWIEAEDILGKNTPDIIDELQAGRASMKTQRALMWAGLRKHHPDVTLNDAGEMLIEAAEAMSRALTSGTPQGEGSADGGEGPTKRKKLGIGTASTPVGVA